MAATAVRRGPTSPKLDLGHSVHRRCCAGHRVGANQTAAAVERDLRRSLAQWEAEQRIDAFALAEDDTPDRLVIPETLYGRAREFFARCTAIARGAGPWVSRRS